MGRVSADQAWLQLVGAAGIGPHTIRRLLNAYGSAEEIVAAAAFGTLNKVAETFGDDVSARLAGAIVRSKPQDELAILSRRGGGLLPMDSPDYPNLLLQIPDPPPLLRVAGDLEALTASCVAVVGTRRCSPAGLLQASRFASSLAEAGIVVVSGGARGIDVEAHRSVLRAGGRTIVVLGSGLASTYPPEHAALFDEVRNGGGLLVSELPVPQPPRPSQFPKRNRIISGLSTGVLVIEAPKRSGAMLTARLAVEAHGREGWAVAADAGRIEARGGVEAIRDGWAQCVIDPADVLADVVGERERSVAAADGVPGSEAVDLSRSQRCVLDQLRKGGMEMGTLLDRVDLPAPDSLRAVTSLELAGLVVQQRGQVSMTPTGVLVAAAARQPS